MKDNKIKGTVIVLTSEEDKEKFRRLFGKNKTSSTKINEEEEENNG